MILKILIWMFILALFHALQETQIEGKEGWARHLPTFRINVFLTKLLIGKDLSGYHLFMLIMWFIIFHGIFLFQTWTFKIELTIMGFFSLYWVIEDFLFFVVNPHYGIKSFRPNKIDWHKRWFCNCIPVSYAWGIILGISLLLIGGN